MRSTGTRSRKQETIKIDSSVTSNTPWIGAACLTCRQKSRRCDRARPACKRCISKGLECGGYPDKFRFCGIASRGKWKNQDAPIDQATSQLSSEGLTTTSSTPNKASPPKATENSTSVSTQPRGIDAILEAEETKRLLSHCEST